MPRPRPPYLHRERSRHGAFVWYVRREHGQRIRLRADYGTEAFWTEYRAAIEGAAVPEKPKARPHTLRWVIEQYQRRSAWTALKISTRKQRGNILQAVIGMAGDWPLNSFTEEVIRKGRDRRDATPHAANNFIKTMRSFFAWAIEEGLIETNPATGVKMLKGANSEIGFHTWTEAEVARFEARWPLGTRQRLAFDVLLYTGLRRGDAVRLGRQHVRNGLITIRAEKTGRELILPLLPVLADSIAATKTGDLAFIATEYGRPFVKESFGNWFREACHKAGCPGSAHGLRKAGATRAAENGATERQLMAIFGWSSGKMATHYTRAAEDKWLARDAGSLLLPARTENGIRPHLIPDAPAPSAKRLKSKGK